MWQGCTRWRRTWHSIPGSGNTGRLLPGAAPTGRLSHSPLNNRVPQPHLSPAPSLTDFSLLPSNTFPNLLLTMQEMHIYIKHTDMKPTLNITSNIFGTGRKEILILACAIKNILQIFCHGTALADKNPMAFPFSVSQTFTSSSVYLSISWK